MPSTEKKKLPTANTDSAMSKSAKPQDTAQVFFPCVHGEASGQLVTVSCFQANELKSAIKVVSGIDDETARRIIGAARYSEMDDRAAAGVLALFNNPLFGGESYGLALSLADKMIRYGRHGEWTEIYATGKIPPDGCGAVEAIKEIEKKLDLILSNGKPGSLFVFPSENLTEHSDNLKITLTKLEKKNIRWIAIHNLKDLDGILWKSTDSKREYGRLNGVEVWMKNMTKALLSNKWISNKYTIVSIICLASIAVMILLFNYYAWEEPIDSKTDIGKVTEMNAVESVRKADQSLKISEPVDNNTIGNFNTDHIGTKIHEMKDTSQTDKNNKMETDNKTVLESAPIDGMAY